MGVLVPPGVALIVTGSTGWWQGDGVGVLVPPGMALLAGLGPGALRLR